MVFDGTCVSTFFQSFHKSVHMLILGTHNGYKTLLVRWLCCIGTRVVVLLVGYGRASQSPTFHTRGRCVSI
jgi:hypothetical protein